MKNLINSVLGLTTVMLLTMPSSVLCQIQTIPTKGSATLALSTGSPYQVVAECTLGFTDSLGVGIVVAKHAEGVVVGATLSANIARIADDLRVYTVQLFAPIGGSMMADSRVSVQWLDKDASLSLGAGFVTLISFAASSIPKVLLPTYGLGANTNTLIIPLVQVWPSYRMGGTFRLIGNIHLTADVSLISQDVRSTILTRVGISTTINVFTK